MNFGQILEKPDKRYSPAAFWFWYGTLKPEVLRRQVDMMAEQGVWNAFMHSRAYLETPYLGEGWWRAVSAAVDEARMRGFYAWMYDEYAWPSGTAGSVFADDAHQEPSRVLSGDPSFTAKCLCVKRAGESGEALAAFERDGERMEICVQRRPGIVDYMNKAAVRYFMDVTHEEYARRYAGDFGAAIPGVFFDEIYMSGQLPWTEGFAGEFKRRRGYDLMPELALLVEDGGERGAQVREDYYGVVAELYEEAFFKQIGEWCLSHGLSLTGHTEEALIMHPWRQGDYFRTMRHLQIPGADCHAYRYTYPRRITLCEPKYAVSVARLYDKPRSMSESMGGAGWACTLQEYKRGINTMTAAGISMHVLHGFAYEERTQGEQGDWPASFFYQNPYWPMFHVFADYVSRLCKVNESGRPVVDVALYYPIRDMWRHTLNGHPNEIAQGIARSFDAALNVLMNNQIDADFLDADSILRARVEQGRLCVGKERFRLVLLPQDSDLPGAVAAALKGVAVVRYGKDMDSMLRDVERAIDPDVRVLEGERAELFVNHRKIEGRDVYFISNSTPRARACRLSLRGSGPVARWNLDAMRAVAVDAREADGRVEFDCPLGADEAVYIELGREAEAPLREIGELTLRDEWVFMPSGGEALELPFVEVGGRKTLARDVFSGRTDVGRFATDWQGKWITRRASWYCDGNRPELFFRREFALKARPVRARACVAAVGEYVVRINGREAVRGAGWREPACADVGALLRAGKNLIEVDVNNPTPMDGNNLLWQETIDPDRPTSLLMQLEVECADGGRVVIGSDAEFIVSARLGTEPVVHGDVDMSKARGLAPQCGPGEWLHAWERGAPPLEPWGDVPLFGQRARYPRMVEYAVELPAGCVGIDPPEVRGECEYALDGRLVNPDEVRGPGKLTLSVRARSAGDGLLAPVKARMAPQTVAAGDWRELGLGDYSGACRYSQRFDMRVSPGSRYTIRLGDVRFYARVTLNGRLAGDAVWMPYELDVTGLVRDGENELTIEVANTAANERRHMLCDAGRAIGWNRYWNEDNMDRDGQNYVSGLIGRVSIVELAR